MKYLKPNRNIFIYSFLFMVFILGSCKKKEINRIPSIVLKQNNGFVYADTVIGKCSKMNFGIIADGNGEKITNMVVTTESNGVKRTLIDFGLFKDVLDTSISIFKSDFENEKFTFKVMNKDRQFAEKTVLIKKSAASNCGAIKHYQSVTLGFQSNTEFAHFLDADSNKYINSSLPANILNTGDIAVYYYLDAGKPSPTFSSPGDQDAIGYYSELSAWGNLPYTAWDYMTILTVNDFNNISDASGLIAAYNEVWGRRKYKYAYKDFVFPFKTSQGKLGVVKVNFADNSADGKVNFDLKIQE